MTVSVLRNKAQYTGNGSSTQFEITFAYTETSQIKVYLDGSLQTLTTHYTITDPGQTGTVTFVTAPDSGVVISLIRETDYLQTVDYANNDILDAETLESAFDKLTMMCQQLKSLIDGSVGFDETVSSAETTSLKLAAGITDLAGKLLAFDATGNFVTTQEIGTWQGNYSASTDYVVRDIVKDSSTDNVYFTKRNAPAGTSLSNTTYFALLVDVETVRTLKEAAELAESNAETAQTAAEAALASFQGQYKVGATNPYSGTPDAGDLWYDTTNSILKYYVSGTGFEPVTTSLATVTDNYLTISNQVITAGTVPISLGGTGATTASGARTALGLAIGTNVQAYDADTAKYDDTTANFTGTLQNGGSNVVVDSDIGSTVQAYDADLSAIAGLSNADGNFIVGSATGWTVESGATARTSLGLGTLATQSTITESQISDLQNYLTAETNDLSTAVTGTLPIVNGGTGATDAATARTNLDVDQAGTDNSTDVSLVTTSHDYLSITGQAITLGPIDLAADVTGNLPYASISGTPTLGTAAAEDVGYFATAAQGSLADSAVQPGDNLNTLGSGSELAGKVIRSNGAGGVAWYGLTVDLPTEVASTLQVTNGGTGVTALSSLDAADLGSGAATDGYVLTADGAGNAAWEAASGGGGGTTAYLEHSSTISDSFTVSSGTNRMYIGGTTFSGTITVAGRLAIVAGPANFTGTINITGTLAAV